VRSLRDLPEPPEWITLDSHDENDDADVFQRLSTALSAAALNIELGSGTRAFFHQLNCSRPAHGSFLRWTMNPTVHALDDTTVMQSAESVPWSVRTAASFANGRPLAVGPETLRMRFNPEQQGPSSQSSPIDPRQRGLFAAAWTLAHCAGLLHPSVDRVAFFEPIGPRGVIYRKADAPQPWFDEQPSPAAFPVFVVLAALCQARGLPASPLLASDTSNPGLIGIRIGGETPHLLVANTTTQTLRCTLPAQKVAVLNEQSFADACLHPAGFWESHAAPTTTPLELSPYSVACLWA
jgi:D-apionolactonase